MRSRLPGLAWAGLAGLVVFQAWAYYNRLPLSLGPRVILEPWLIRRGFVLYEHIADLHTPLVPLILAALAPLAPDGLTLAKLVLVALLSLTTALTFVVGWRRIGWLGGLWAGAFLVVWSPPFVFGKLWHEAFLAPLYLLWVLSYTGAGAPRSIRASLGVGLLGGVAVLIKQHAAVVFLAFLLWSALTAWHFRRSATSVLRETGLAIAAAVLPVAAYGVHQYLQAGTLNGFLYWTIAYGLASPYASLTAAYPTITQIRDIASSCLLMPAAILCLVDSIRRGEGTWLHLGLGILLAAASAVTAYPRFGFFHLQATLPMMAWVSALTLAYASRAHSAGRFFVGGIALALSAFWLITAGYSYAPVATAGAQQKVSEYADLVPLARAIEPYLRPADQVYVFPDDEANANLYYLLRRSPPRFWIFHYPWNLLDWVRGRILATLEESPPEWIIYFPGRWDAERRAPEIAGYIQGHYRREASLQWAQGDVQLLGRQPSQPLARNATERQPR